MMARHAEIASAAGEIVEQFADYDDEFGLHQALVGDETFGTLALLKKELAIQAKYGDLEGDVETHAEQAADAIDAALDARASQLKALPKCTAATPCVEDGDRE